jgi:hypothetical protein
VQRVLKEVDTRHRFAEILYTVALLCGVLEGHRVAGWGGGAESSRGTVVWSLGGAPACKKSWRK